jgi:VanZ family protein
LISAAFGLSDELHQHFVPGRDASALDLAADTVGSLAGVLAWTFLVHRKATGEKKNGIMPPDATEKGVPKD